MLPNTLLTADAQAELALVRSLRKTTGKERSDDDGGN